MFKTIKDLFTTTKQSAHPLPNSNFILETETFDPKSAVVPGPMIQRPLDFYIFCMDPKASDNKNFLYYKKVYSRESTLEDAKRTLSHLSATYTHIIVSYDPITEEVHGCPANQVDLVRTRIKEYNSQIKESVGEALSEFVVRSKKD